MLKRWQKQNLLFRYVVWDGRHFYYSPNHHAFYGTLSKCQQYAKQMIDVLLINDLAAGYPELLSHELWLRCRENVRVAIYDEDRRHYEGVLFEEIDMSKTTPFNPAGHRRSRLEAKKGKVRGSS